MIEQIFSSLLFQGIRRTINPSGDHGCFPSTDTMLSSESETNSGGCPTPPRSSTTSATVDKYSKAFAPLRRKSKVDKSNLQGWSGKVLHGTHKLGWSDDVLGVSDLSSEDELCSSEAAAAAAAAAGSQLSTASVEEEPGWMYGGIKGQSWETSPNRRFVRNFP